MSGVSLGAMLLRTLAPEDELDQAVALAPHVDELWVVEDLGFAGGISQATAVLHATAHLPKPPRVGHGIAPAPFRNPAALAMEWSTLARMFPGRLHAGIGHGVPAWMSQIGEAVDSPLTLLEEVIASTRSLLHGEEVSLDGRHVKLRDVQLHYPPDPPPLVSAGVEGPKSLELAGRVADGTILPEGKGPAAIEQARQLIDKGRAASAPAGVAAHRLTLFTAYYCGDPRELPPPPFPMPADGFDAIAPSPGEIVDRLQSVVDAGVDAVVLVHVGPDPVAQIALAATEIWPVLVT